MSSPFIGQILAVGFNFAPRGWSIANGATLGIAQNAALFSLLGTYYGGNGQTTFQLPNLQGRVAIGQGQSGGTSVYQIGQFAGVESTSLNLAQLPVHNHGATTTVTPGSTLAATTAITALGAPTARVIPPAGNFLTSGFDPGTSAVTQNFAAPSAGTPVTLAPGSATTTLTGAITATATTTVANAGGSQPVGILQPYVTINYIIALEGIFPSRN